MTGNLGISYEHFASRIFGDIYHGSASYFEEGIYKKFLRKLSVQIKNIVRKNVRFTDGFHKKMVELSLERIESSMKDQNYEAQYIKGLVELLFWMMGTHPENMGKPNLRGKEIANFQAARSLTYQQSELQKMCAILQAHRYSSEFAEVVGENDLRRLFITRGNDLSFVEWYKKNYTDLYLKLF